MAKTEKLYEVANDTFTHRALYEMFDIPYPVNGVCAIRFKATGEVRPPKNGEFFIASEDLCPEAYVSIGDFSVEAHAICEPVGIAEVVTTETIKPLVKR